MDTFDIGGELTVGRLGFGAMRITGEDIIGEPDEARWPATRSSTTTTATSTTRCRQARPAC